MAGHNLLMLITRYGESKDYILDKFEEMLEACVYPVDGVDIIYAGDRAGDDIKLPSGLSYTDDIVTPARETARKLALHGGYEKMLWQGVDALYQSREDFEQLISHDLPIVSTLISARTVTNFACARRWRYDGSGKRIPCQDDVTVRELESGRLVPAGWPSADTIVFRHDTLDIDVLSNYEPWYKREYYSEQTGVMGTSLDPAAARGRLASSERFCLEAANRGFDAWIDTSIKTWHVHESGAHDGGPLARLWPDTEVPMKELTW